MKNTFFVSVDERAQHFFFVFLHMKAHPNLVADNRFPHLSQTFSVETFVWTGFGASSLIILNETGIVIMLWPSSNQVQGGKDKLISEDLMLIFLAIWFYVFI